MDSETSGPGTTSLGKMTTILVVSRGARFAVALVNSVLIARVLGVERLGAYAYAMGIAALFGLLPNMGIATLVTRSVARDPVNGARILRTALTAQGWVSAATFFVIPGVASLLPGQPVPLLYLWLSAAQLTLGTLSWPYLGLLSGRVRYDRVALAELVSALSGTACLAVSALLLGTPAGFLGAQVAAAVLSVTAARSLARPFFPHGVGRSPTSVRKLLRSGLPFGAAAATDSLYRRLDVLLLGQMSSTVALGLYNVAYKPTNLLVYFGTTLAGPLFPLMASGSRTKSPPEFRHTMRGLSILAPAMILLFSGMAAPLLRLLYGSDFVDAAPVLVVLVWSAAANWLYAPLSTALQAQGRERWWLSVLLLGLVLNAGGNLWAIPRWGALGAAAATCGSEVAIFLIAGSLSCVHFRELPPLRPLVLVSFATAGSGTVLYLLSSRSGPITATLVAVALYGVGLLVLRVVRRDEARTVLGWMGDAARRLLRRRHAGSDDSREIASIAEQGG